MNAGLDLATLRQQRIELGDGWVIESATLDITPESVAEFYERDGKLYRMADLGDVDARTIAGHTFPNELCEWGGDVRVTQRGRS